MHDPDTDPRLAEILELILRLGEGDLDARGKLSESRDDLDGIVAGLNMLADELGAEREARLRVEELLRDEIDAYENAPGLFCSLDASTLEVLKCNTTLALALGRTKAQLLGCVVTELHTEGCREAVRVALEAIAQGRPSRRMDFELERAGCAPLVVQMGASATRNEQGAAKRIRLVWRDVTEQRSLESQLLQAQKLEGIGRLAGGIAHDFNNMLTIIVGNASMAKASSSPGSQVAEDLEQIEEAAQRGAELTRGLLAFSRKTVIRPRAATLAAIVENAQMLLRRLIGDDVRIETDHAPDPWSVLVDVAQFEQIIVNLAINSRDAMPEGGTLTLVTENVVVDDSYPSAHPDVQPGHYARLSVSDTGVGMAREVRERAFEPFFTTKPPGKGTGLGLAVCYGVVQQANGRVSLDSEPGRGTTVKIYLPQSSEHEGRAEVPVVTSPSEGGTETILLAEDDARVREINARILRSAGYRVLEAVNGKQALDLALAFEGTIDLVLSDVMMPEMGGPQLVDELRRRNLVCRAILVSGYTERDVLQRSDGEVEFLGKPFGPAILLERVRMLLAETERPR
jgi:two-component system, cell cycle sensor histidine kinase and response regulator CckA